MRLYTGNDKTATGLFWDKDVTFTINDPCENPSRSTPAKADPKTYYIGDASTTWALSQEYVISPAFCRV